MRNPFRKRYAIEWLLNDQRLMNGSTFYKEHAATRHAEWVQLWFPSSSGIRHKVVKLP